MPQGSPKKPEKIKSGFAGSMEELGKIWEHLNETERNLILHSTEEDFNRIIREKVKSHRMDSITADNFRALRILHSLYNDPNSPEHSLIDPLV